MAPLNMENIRTTQKQQKIAQLEMLPKQKQKHKLGCQPSKICHIIM